MPTLKEEWLAFRKMTIDAPRPSGEPPYEEHEISAIQAAWVAGAAAGGIVLIAHPGAEGYAAFRKELGEFLEKYKPKG